jgi:hypothetical protein
MEDIRNVYHISVVLCSAVYYVPREKGEKVKRVCVWWWKERKEGMVKGLGEEKEERKKEDKQLN